MIFILLLLICTGRRISLSFRVLIMLSVRNSLGNLLTRYSSAIILFWAAVIVVLSDHFDSSLLLLDSGGIHNLTDSSAHRCARVMIGG